VPGWASFRDWAKFRDWAIFRGNTVFYFHFKKAALIFHANAKSLLTRAGTEYKNEEPPKSGVRKGKNTDLSEIRKPKRVPTLFAD
jgi:hypothetical protein